MYTIETKYLHTPIEKALCKWGDFEKAKRFLKLCQCFDMELCFLEGLDLSKESFKIC